MLMKEISDKYATKQPKQIDTITKDCPFLDSINYVETTHGLQHNYEKLTEAVGGDIVEMDEPLKVANSESKMDWAELGIMGFTMEVPLDKLNALFSGDFAKYLAKKSPALIRATTMKAEKTLVEKVVIPFAQKNGKVIDCGATGDKTYYMVAIRWVEEEFCGLYDPNGFGQGALVEAIPLSNGANYKNAKGQTVKGCDFKSYFGLLAANPNNVSVIVNIDKDHIPTEDQMDEMLLQCRASANTYIYCHPAVKNLLNKYKGSKLSMGPGDTNYSRATRNWDGVGIVPDWNFEPRKAYTSEIEGTDMFEVKAWGENYWDSQALPQNTEIISGAISGCEGGSNGGILIRARKTGDDLVIAEDKTLSFRIETSKNKTVNFKTLATVTADLKNEFLLEYVLPPNTLKYTRVIAITDDDAASGNIMVYPTYLPR